EIRPRRRLHLHAGGSGPHLQGDPRASATDRGQGGAKVTTSRSQPPVRGISRQYASLTRNPPLPQGTGGVFSFRGLVSRDPQGSAASALPYGSRLTEECASCPVPLC